MGVYQKGGGHRLGTVFCFVWVARLNGKHTGTVGDLFFAFFSNLEFAASGRRSEIARRGIQLIFLLLLQSYKGPAFSCTFNRIYVFLRSIGQFLQPFLF